jgi:hypothetical protein
MRATSHRGRLLGLGRGGPGARSFVVCPVPLHERNRSGDERDHQTDYRYTERATQASRTAPLGRGAIFDGGSRRSHELVFERRERDGAGISRLVERGKTMGRVEVVRWPTRCLPLVGRAPEMLQLLDQSAIFVQPLAQAGPRAEQRLVRNLDVGSRVAWSRSTTSRR